MIGSHGPPETGHSLLDGIESGGDYGSEIEEQMIKPTVGRVVLFTPSSNDTIAHIAGEPCAAIITKAWSDTCVNLAVFDVNGVSHGRTSVVLVQEGQSKPDGYFCEWMAYQKAVAKGEVTPTLHETPK